MTTGSRTPRLRRLVVALTVAFAPVVAAAPAAADVSIQTTQPAPSASFSVEWMRTTASGDAPWVDDLTLRITAADGTDVSGNCMSGDGIEQDGFKLLVFDCNGLADGRYAIELVGVPSDEELVGGCTEFDVPATTRFSDRFNCLFSFFSAGEPVDTVPPDDPYPPAAPVVSVSDATPAAGGTVLATVTGCVPGEAVTFTLGGASVTTTCDDDGTASATLDVPTSGGALTGTAVLAQSGTTLSFDIVAAAPASTIPRTGNTDPSRTATVALAFLLLGAAFVVGSRVRRRTA